VVGKNLNILDQESLELEKEYNIFRDLVFPVSFLSAQTITLLIRCTLAIRHNFVPQHEAN